MTSKKGQRSKVILLPIDYSYTTSYKLSIVNFALGRTVSPQHIPYRQRADSDRRTQHCSI